MRDFKKLPSFRKLQALREAAKAKSEAIAAFTRGDQGKGCDITVEICKDRRPTEPETDERVAHESAGPFGWKTSLPEAAGWYVARAVHVHSESDLNTIAWFDGHKWGGWARIGLQDDRMLANKHYVHNEQIVWLRPCTFSEIPAFDRVGIAGTEP